MNSLKRSISCYIFCCVSCNRGAKWINSSSWVGGEGVVNTWLRGVDIAQSCSFLRGTNNEYTTQMITVYNFLRFNFSDSEYCFAAYI